MRRPVARKGTDSTAAPLVSLCTRDGRNPPFPLETSGAQTKRRTPTARRPMRCSCQSKTPANPDPFSNPIPLEAQPIVDRATRTISISISHRKRSPPSAVWPTYRR